MTIKLRGRDLEVLDDLRAACDNYLKLGLADWVQPLDCGGSNGSDHSYRLSKLAKTEFVEAKRRGGWSRGSKSYRITDAGRAALASTASAGRDE